MSAKKYGLDDRLREQRKSGTNGSSVRHEFVQSASDFIVATRLLDKIIVNVNNLWGTLWLISLRHSAIIRKVAGSIPDGVTAIFH